MGDKDILISVGTGVDQVPLIKKAYELGFIVIAFDKSPNPICQKWAIHIFTCSTHDYNKAITNILWPGVEAAWPLLVTPDNEQFPGAHHSMSIPEVSKLHTWLPFWNTLCLITMVLL